MTSTPHDPTTGDYPDRDLPAGDVDPGEGTYTDQETVPEKRGEEPDVRGPGDRGEYTDSEHVAEHRPQPPQPGYTSKDTSTTKDTGSSSGNDEVEEHPHG